MPTTDKPAEPIVPKGYVIEGERETTQLVPGHGAQQGVVYGVRHPSGLQTTVFVPYARMTDEPYVRQVIADHIAGVRRVEGMSTA